jgi:gliding motility-associated-like protein
LIFNGDFENGNIGFTSEYTNDCDRVPLMMQEGYCVNTDPSSQNNYFASCLDHTSGIGNMMIVDGSTISGQEVWCQNVNVTQNTDYEFSAWLSTILAFNPSILRFEINGSLIGNPLNAPVNTCDWQNYAASWNSGINNNARICLINENITAGGNDFALDDIEFAPIIQLPNFKDSIFIIVNDTPIVNLGNDIRICPEDSIMLDAQNPGATYLWNTGENSQTIIKKFEGEVIVQVTNSFGCTDTDTIFIRHYIPPVIDLGPDRTICPNAPNEIFDPGDFATYTWLIDAIANGNNRTFETNLAGEYAIRVVDANGCSDTDTVFIRHHIPPTLDLGPDRTICPNAPNEIFDPGDFATYTWLIDASANGNKRTYETKLAGEYAVRVVDANGCTDIDTVFIRHHIPPIVDLGPDRTICTNAPNEIFDPGDFATYTWLIDAGANGNNRTFETNLAGEYAVRVVDANGCTDTDTVFIRHHIPPIVDLGPDRTICANAPNEIFDPGDFATYTWLIDAVTNGNNRTFETNLAGEYAVEVIDANGCSNSDTINLTVIQVPQISVLTDATICPDMTHEFNVSTFDNGNGPYTYLWNNGENTNNIIVNTQGNYWVEITDRYGCLGRDEANLLVNSKLDVSIYSAPTISLCFGEDTLLRTNYNSIDGYNFTWSGLGSGNSETVTAATGGVYEVLVDNGLGCEGRAEIEVVIHPLPQISVRDTSFCEGNTISIGTNAVNNYTYNWSTSESTSIIQVNSNNLSSPYKLEVKNSVTGCSSEIDINVVENKNPIVNLENIEVCEGEEITLQSSVIYNNVEYYWNTGENTMSISPSASGLYRLEVKTLDGCKGSSTSRVNFKPKPIIDLGPDITICEGENHTFTIENIYENIIWNNGESSSSITVNDANKYFVSVSLNGCESKDTVELKVNPYPISFIDHSLSNKSYCFEQLEARELSLNAGENLSYEYLWNTGEISNSIWITSPGKYSVTISNGNCSISDEIEFKDYCPWTLFIPNAFSPNDDGLNDIFLAEGINILDFEMYIFNRWGEQIFKSNSIHEGWDGTYMNEEVQIDVYVYLIYYTYEKESGNIEKKQKVGTVTLFK